jgi:precorrin-6Y C5,15-methyltransferase (decarboxylating) CbiT subunit
MTKEEVRTISISKLRLLENSRVLDIGAGTGSISIEIARLVKYGRVYAIEHNEEAISLIEKNCKKFNVTNVELIKGKAPYALDGIKGFSRVIIGGSGGELPHILSWINTNMDKKGRVVVNAITFDTLSTSKQFFEQNDYTKVEIVQVSISKFNKVGKYDLLKGSNPVFIISAQKR